MTCYLIVYHVSINKNLKIKYKCGRYIQYMYIILFNSCQTNKKEKHQQAQSQQTTLACVFIPVCGGLD